MLGQGMRSACPACGAAAELHAIESVLDFQRRALCWACIDASAEPQSVVADAAERWNDVPEPIRDSVSVFDDGDYVPSSEWVGRIETFETQADADDTARARQLVARITETKVNLGWSIRSWAVS